MLTNNCTLKYRNSGTLNSRLLNLKFNNKLGLEIARIARKTKASKGTKVEKVGNVGNVNVKCSCLVLAMLAINSRAWTTDTYLWWPAAIGLIATRDRELWHDLAVIYFKYRSRILYRRVHRVMSSSKNRFSTDRYVRRYVILVIRRLGPYQLADTIYVEP